VHETSVQSKAIVRAFYGRDAGRSYFDGCSDGGREALMEAQRYPDDFVGILAGAPANNWAPLSLYQAWLVRANMDAQGGQILDASKLPALHAAVMRECADAHGVIRDPRACTFDPASIQCPAGSDRPDCLTPAQVGAARRLYRGPTADGVQLFNGGEPFGSEVSWQGWMIGPAGDAAWPNDVISASIALDYFRYMAYWRNPPASFSLRDIRFTLDTYRGLQPLGRIYNANDPDLEAFRARGGKLILYHGWADQAISPWSSLDYYRAVAREMGGFAATQRFSRLYMIPGLYHCPCGPYPTGDPPATVDLMDELVGWVENRSAPGEVTLPVTSSSSTLSVKPFNPLEPAPRNDGLNSNYRYIGARSAYRPGQELWCETQEQRLVCRGAPSSHARGLPESR
jgi:feruloyl esterase